MYKPKLLLITTLCCLLTIILMAATLAADYRRMQDRLTSHMHYVYSSVYDTAYINEALLQNFATLIGAAPHQQAAIRSFANTMRQRYPHLIRLQVQQATTGNASLPQAVGSPLREIPPASRFPLTFVEPLTAETRYLLGRSLLNDGPFAETLAVAQRYHQPVASPPFSLEDDVKAYALFLGFYEHDAPPDEKNFYIASLLIDTASLLPDASFLDQGTEVTLSSEYGAVLDRRQAPGDRLIAASWLPNLQEQHTINRFGQSFKLHASQQVGLQNLSLGVLLGILLSACSGYLLLRVYLRQKASIDAEHTRIYEKLRTERQQLETRIQQRTQELHDQLIENRRLTHQVLAVQEAERRNLSRELHDELGQSLTAIRTDAKILKRSYPQENSIVHQACESIDAIAQHIYDVTYGMMRTLRPAALDDLGLVGALQECIVASRFEEHNITLHSDLRGALNSLSEDYNITLFRLTQEAFSNILKHARADNVWLDLQRLEQTGQQDSGGDRIELIIRDDGIGFDVAAQAFKSGFGLTGMRERVRALGGVFQVQHNPDRGTRIKAVIPLAAERPATTAVAAIPDRAAAAEHEH